MKTPARSPQACVKMTWNCDLYVAEFELTLLMRFNILKPQLHKIINYCI